MFDVLDHLGRGIEFLSKKLKRTQGLSVAEYDKWKQLQYKNELAYAVYLEQRLITEEYKNKVPIHRSKLWLNWIEVEEYYNSLREFCG